MRRLAALVARVAFVAIAACGGSVAPSRTPAGSAPAPVGTATTRGAASFGDTTFRGAMRPVAATTMSADLTSMGLDPNALPALENLPPDTLRKVMKTFTRALGAKCTDCHADDFGADTPRKAIAANMWDQFSRRLAMAAGGPVYCDSCHQGTLTPLLDRHDPKALSRWMDQNFVARLTPRSGKASDCVQCHGEPFDGHFLKKWARGTAKEARP